MHCNILISMKKTMTLPLIFVFNWSISTDSIKDNRQSTLLNLTTRIENMEINVFVRLDFGYNYSKCYDSCAQLAILPNPANYHYFPSPGHSSTHKIQFFIKCNNGQIPSVILLD